MVDQVVYLPASQWSKVIDPAGDTKSSLIAKKVRDQLGIPYGAPEEGAGVYGRVVEVITTPGRAGKTLLAITTFPAGVEGVVFSSLPAVHLVVVEKNDAIKEVQLTDEKLQALQGKATSAYYRRQAYNEILDALFPGNYDWVGENKRELVVRFPEVEVSNRDGLKHTIYDLFVKMTFNTILTRFTKTPEGRRMSLSMDEIIIGYRHSHLYSNSNSWGNNFCLGHTTFADKATDFIERDIDTDHFMVFLFQLKDYVAWESLDGGPYIRISTLKRTSAKGTVSTSTSASAMYTPQNVNINDAFITARMVLLRLTPEQLVYDILQTGERRWRVNTSNEKVLDLIRQFTSGNNVADYDVLAGEYIPPTGTTDVGRLRAAFLQCSMEFQGSTLKPKVLGEDTGEGTVRKIARMPVPGHIIATVRLIDQLLNQKLDPFQTI